MKRLWILLILSGMFGGFTTTAFAQVPHLIHYQGQTTDSQGVGLEGPYTLIFRLYDAATAGNKLWEETQPNVPITGGHFSVLLGQITPLNPDWTQPLWLALEVDLNPLVNEELSPRQPITSVPLALMAERLDGPITTVGNNVGIGTANPTQRLHVFGGPNPVLLVESDSQDSARLQIKQANAGVGLNSAWELIAYSGGGTRRFSIGDAVAQAHRMTIDQDGKVGIGTTAPHQMLDVNGYVQATGFYSTSDQQFKTHIATLANALDKVMQLRGVSYEWNAAANTIGATPGKHEIGVIAQEVAAVFPELTTGGGGGGPMAVDYTHLTAVLIEAVKELNAKVDALQQQLNTLQQP